MSWLIAWPPDRRASRRLGRLARRGRGGQRTQGKALFQPIRVALTGRGHGRELDRLWPLIAEGADPAGRRAVRPLAGGQQPSSSIA